MRISTSVCRAIRSSFDRFSLKVSQWLYLLIDYFYCELLSSCLFGHLFNYTKSPPWILVSFHTRQAPFQKCTPYWYLQLLFKSLRTCSNMNNINMQVISSFNIQDGVPRKWIVYTWKNRTSLLKSVIISIILPFPIVMQDSTSKLNVREMMIFSKVVIFWLFWENHIRFCWTRVTPSKFSAILKAILGFARLFLVLCVHV